VLDLGSPIHRKTLTRLTVAAEPGHSGRISFGYETQMVTGAYQAQTVARAAAETGGMGGLDLTALDFNDFSLSGFAASWTARLNARNVNYIAFRWLSEEPSDSRVDSIIPGYVSSTALNQRLSLTPVWRVTTDTGAYQLDLVSGELTRLA
jgi:hypothetical protein